MELLPPKSSIHLQIDIGDGHQRDVCADVIGYANASQRMELTMIGLRPSVLDFKMLHCEKPKLSASVMMRRAGDPTD